MFLTCPASSCACHQAASSDPGRIPGWPQPAGPAARAVLGAAAQASGSSAPPAPPFHRRPPPPSGTAALPRPGAAEAAGPPGGSSPPGRAGAEAGAGEGRQRGMSAVLSFEGALTGCRGAASRCRDTPPPPPPSDHSLAVTSKRLPGSGGLPCSFPPYSSTSPAPRPCFSCPTGPGSAGVPSSAGGGYQGTALGTKAHTWSQAVLAGGDTSPPPQAWHCPTSVGQGPQPQGSQSWEPWGSRQSSRGAAVPGQGTTGTSWDTASLGTGLTQRGWDRASLSRHGCPPCWGTGCCQFTLPGVTQHTPHPQSQTVSGRNFPLPNGGWGKACVCNSPLLSLPSPVTVAAREGACHVCLQEGAEQKLPGRESSLEGTRDPGQPRGQPAPHFPEEPPCL